MQVIIGVPLARLARRDFFLIPHNHIGRPPRGGSVSPVQPASVTQGSQLFCTDFFLSPDKRNPASGVSMAKRLPTVFTVHLKSSLFCTDFSACSSSWIETAPSDTHPSHGCGKPAAEQTRVLEHRGHVCVERRISPARNQCGRLKHTLLTTCSSSLTKTTPFGSHDRQLFPVGVSQEQTRRAHVRHCSLSLFILP